MAKMDEEELGIYRTKDSVSRSKTRKLKWLCNSGALATMMVQELACSI
jgi:hypothetical protein